MTDHNPKGASGYGEQGGTWIDLEDSYDIPYRCLIPKGIEGLIVAGRAISASHEAHGSFRTQGGVMAIGQPVGTAAALAAQRGIVPREVPVETLQETLIAHGASLFRDHQKAAQQAQRAREAIERSRPVKWCWHDRSR